MAAVAVVVAGVGEEGMVLCEQWASACMCAAQFAWVVGMRSAAYANGAFCVCLSITQVSGAALTVCTDNSEQAADWNWATAWGLGTPGLWEENNAKLIPPLTPPPGSASSSSTTESSEVWRRSMELSLFLPSHVYLYPTSWVISEQRSRMLLKMC